MISREKLSKKARREMDNRKRQLWARNPVTRVKESGKAYHRVKIRMEFAE